MKQQKRVIVATSGPKESITCSRHVKQRKGINVATLKKCLKILHSVKQQKLIYVAKLDGIKSLDFTLCRMFDYCHGWTGKNMNCEETDRKSLGFFVLFILVMSQST